MGTSTTDFDMAYTSNIPQSTDNPSDSQPLLLANFLEIDTYTSVNHVALNDPDQGKHKFMQMPEQASAPTTAANEGALYTKESSSVTNLFFRRESNGAEVQLTGGVSTVGGQSSVTLPNGLIVKYGSIASVAVDGNSTVTFTNAFPTAVRSIQVSMRNDNGKSPGVAYVRNTGLTVNGFTFSRSGGTDSQGAFWVAIGD